MEADVFDPGNGIEPLAAIARELRDAGRLLVAVAGERHLHGQHIMGIEAGTDTAEGEKGANEQRRADQQHQGQRDLADDEQRASLALPEAGAGAVAALLQGGVEVGARGAEGREESEEDAGEQRDGEGEGEYAPIDADGGAVFANTGQAGGTHGQQGAHAHEAEQQAKNAASDGEQHAFGEQLADDACPAGSECGADRKFAFASGGADQQKIGHVGAGDEKHEADRAKQHQQRLAHVANDTVAERLNGETLLADWPSGRRGGTG